MGQTPPWTHRTRARAAARVASGGRYHPWFSTIGSSEKGTPMKMTRLAVVAVAALLTSAPMLFAQTAAGAAFTGRGMAGFGAGVALIGAGWGFGRIGAAALESMARQPEVAGRIQTAMIVIAALLEGATFFALIVCILVAGNATF